MSVREEILNFQEAHGGLIHVDELHEWAKKNKKSSLHSSLEWDDTKAGYEYRKEQLRRLIRVYVVTPEQKRETISLSIDRMKDGGYRAIDAVMRDVSLREIALADALAELKRVRARYSHISKLAQVWSAIDTAVDAEEATMQPAA